MYIGYFLFIQFKVTMIDEREWKKKRDDKATKIKN